MGRSTIGHMRAIVRAGNYVVTQHAEEELTDDDLTLATSKKSSSAAPSSKSSETVSPVKPNTSSAAAPSTAAKRSASSKSAQPAGSSSSPSISTDDLCANCGKPNLTTRLVTRSYGSGTSLVVVEGIPMASCPHCHTTYFEAATLATVERVRRNGAPTRAAPVLRFG